MAVRFDYARDQGSPLEIKNLSIGSYQGPHLLGGPQLQDLVFLVLFLMFFPYLLEDLVYLLVLY